MMPPGVLSRISFDPQVHSFNRRGGNNVLLFDHRMMVKLYWSLIGDRQDSLLKGQCTLDF
jgi:hypothetical protein